MDNSHVARTDREFLRAVKQQNINDIAKIGLLVGLYQQHAETNELLTHVREISCNTNRILGQISNTLDRLAVLQAGHLAEVQRERELKEVLFQFEKFLADAEQSNDPIAAAYGMRRLLEILDRPNRGFTTAALSDLGDKRHFDSLVTKAKAILVGLTNDQIDELDKFESFVGIYHQRQTMGLDVQKLYPMKAKAKLRPEELDSAKTPEQEKLEADKNKLAQDEMKWYVRVGCGSFLTFMGCFGLLMVVSGNIPTESGKDINPVGGFIAYLVFAIAGVWLLKPYFKGAERRTEIKKRKELLEQELKKHTKEQRRNAEAAISQKNVLIDEYNAQIEDNRRLAKRDFEAATIEMRQLINRFLDQHPPIQRFVARV